MTSTLLLLACALGCVWWIARNPEDHIMMTLTASANDIERALQDLHHLATTGADNDARNAAQFLLALWDGDLHPLNLQDFRFLTPQPMRQALQLFTFLMTTGTGLQKFMSEEAISQVADNLRALNGPGINSGDYGNGSSGAMARSAPPAPPAARVQTY